MGRQDASPVFFHDELSDESGYFRLGEGILGRAALQKSPFLVEDAGQSPDFLLIASSPITVKSLLCVPIIDGDELLGGINLSHSQQGVFDEQLQRSLEVVADQAAKALRNSLLIIELQQFNQRLEQEVAKGYRRLADSERRYRFLVEQAADGIVTVKNGVIDYANPQFWRLAGYDDPPSDIVLADVLDLPGRQQIMTPCQYLEAREQEEACTLPEFHFETQLKHFHNLPVKVEVTGCRVSDAEGVTQQFYVRDISGRLHLDKMKDTFFASLVHELKNPITVINSYLQIMTADAAGYGKKRQKIIVDLDKTSKRLMALLNDILTYSRLKCVQQDVRLKRWLINDEIYRTIEYFQPLVEKKKITVITELQAGMTPFLFDREKIGRVLVNLMDNAIKFTPAGGSLTWRTKVIDVASSTFTQQFSAAGAVLPLADTRTVKGVSVSLEDTGVGVPADNSQVVFDEFFTSTHGEGTGLGLAISRKIVQCHGGTISAERTSRGSKFIFMLPMRLVAE